MNITINIYPSDTEHTILNRVAATLNSTTKYVYVMNEVNRQKRNLTLNVVDILGSMKVNQNFNLFYTDKIQELIKKNTKINLIEDIVKPWIYFNTNTDDVPENIADLFVLEKISTLPAPFNSIQFRNYKEEKTYFLDKLNDEIKRDGDINKLFVGGQEKLNEVQGVQYTSFELEKITKIFTTDVRDLTLYEVFDSIVLTKSLPFSTLNGYYKIFNDVIPNPEWINTSDNIPKDIIYMVINNKEPINIYLSIKDTFLNISFEITHAKKSMNVDKIINNVLQTINKLKPTITSDYEDSVNGMFFIPNQSLDTYVFAHLVLNDSKFNSIYINESDKASKTRESIYLYFEFGNEIISAVITSKKVNRYDVMIRDKSREEFPDGGDYLSIRVSRAKNKDSVTEFQDAISKIITLYNQQYQDVVNFYKLFIKNFGTQKVQTQKVGQEKQFLRKIDPELFSSDYTRRCPSIPSIVSKTEADKLGPKNAMLYPKTPEEGEQRYYTCTQRDDKYKFIGLQKKPHREEISSVCGGDDEVDETTEKYKYVPCCFMTDQQERNSDYNVYYGNQEESKETKIQQKIISTDKLVGYNKYGKLDSFSEVDKFFKSLYMSSDEEVSFLRYGVDKSRLSFLQCVFESIGKKYNGADGRTLTSEQRVSYMKKVLDEISTHDELLSIARQQFPDKTVQEIKECLLGKNNYMNPRYYVSLLEHVFDCKIYIFSCLEDKKGKFELPYHVKNLLCLSSKRKMNTVIILEHIGSESDESSYPQCELVVLNINNVTELNFFPTNEVSQSLLELFNITKKSYSFETEVIDYTLEDTFPKINGQYIDSYGKTNAIVVNVSGINFILYCKNSIPTLNVLENTPFNIPNIDNIRPLLTSAVFRDIKKIVDSENEIVGFELVSSNNNVYYTPVTHVQDSGLYNFEKSDTTFTMPILGDTTSIMYTYNQNKKLAKYLTEYMLYMFSVYIHEKDVKINDTDIQDFVEKHTTVNNSIKYGMIPKRFTINQNVGLVRDNKLVVNSPEVLKRLVYVLRLELSRNTSNVIEYYKKTTVEPYLNDVSDFQNFPTQIILYGKDILEKYINEKNMKFITSEGILFNTTTPYFFKNEKLNPNVFLAQNVDTLEQVNITLKNWENKHINSIESGDIPYILYNYVNEDDIVYVKGDDSSKYIVLIYIKDDDTERFTVLLTT